MLSEKEDQDFMVTFTEWKETEQIFEYYGNKTKPLFFKEVVDFELLIIKKKTL